VQPKIPDRRLTLPIEGIKNAHLEISAADSAGIASDYDSARNEVQVVRALVSR
jgi:hypothetical protein